MGGAALGGRRSPLSQQLAEKTRRACRRPHKCLKGRGYPGRIIFFSDKKTFVVDPAFNPQNDRYIEFYESEDEDEDEEEDEDEDED